jgi:putative transposase
LNVLSRNYFLLEKEIVDSVPMRKLNQRKVRWIIREVNNQERSIYRIAKLQEITPQWTRQLYQCYQESSEYPYPKRPGRKPSAISDEEKQIVLETYHNHPLAAVTLEKILAEQQIHIGHNRIHRILKEAGLAKDEPHKQRRRSYVRYERRFSNGLWHADWFEKQNQQIILFEDDASRFITGYGVFHNATSANAITVFIQAIQTYGIPKQVMTDHGVQFTSLSRCNCASPEMNEFQRVLKQYGVLHIKARVKHPQSNGKVERVGQTIKQLWNHFSSWEDAVVYYNFKRPHSSLENGRLRTPYQAFVEKSREKEKRGVCDA